MFIILKPLRSPGSACALADFIALQTVTIVILECLQLIVVGSVRNTDNISHGIIRIGETLSRIEANHPRHILHPSLTIRRIEGIIRVTLDRAGGRTIRLLGDLPKMIVLAIGQIVYRTV